jgi:hypothetical protein
MRWILFGVALVAFLGCAQERVRSSPREPPLLDLAGGRTGGAASLTAASAFSFVPDEAVAVGLLDPGQLFGDPAWLARMPALAKSAGELHLGGFDPANTRLFFFAFPTPSGLSSVVIGEGKLASIEGGRTESEGGVKIRRFDAPRVGIAWGSGVTLVGGEPALSRALGAGIRGQGKLASSVHLGLFRDLFDRLPPRAALRMVALRSPFVVSWLEKWMAEATPATRAVLKAGESAHALGLALYGHGSSVRLALVLRMPRPEDVRAAAAAASRAVAEARLPPREVPLRADETLRQAALAGFRVQEAGTHLVLEAALPADLLAQVFAR